MNNQYALQPLPYAYDALEPFIDKKTVEIHHDKHQQAYVDKLNMAVNKYPELFSKTVEELLMDLQSIPEPILNDVINQGGGVFNHTFYWKNLIPTSTKAPIGALKTAIEETFGSFEDFKVQFKQSAISNFGSGWTWLVKTKDGHIQIVNTPNQDCPLSSEQTPLITIDLWEHAYYLKYQNKRPDYIDAYFNLVNWEFAEKEYNKP